MMKVLVRSAAISLGFVGLAAGCTRPNAAFDETTGDETRGTGSGSSTSDGPSSGGEGGETGSSVSADADDTSDPITAGDTTGSVCELHDPAPIEIEVFEGGVVPLLPSPDCDDVIVIDEGQRMPVPGGFVHRDCPMCICDKSSPTVRLDFSGTLTLPDMAECSAFVVWAEEGPDGCRWDGFALGAPGLLEIPTFVATNSRSPPVDEFGPIEVELVLEESCEAVAVCEEQPGRHALEFFGGAPIFVDEPDVVTFGFLDGLEYTVTNRMASVDPECGEHVAWTALLQR